MNMEYKLIMAVSGFPSLYDTNSLTYRDLNMRSDAWRQVAELVGVPESECRRKWKTLRDQHRRERQREKERRESGIGLANYRPWRYSSILSFLNPFIDARAAGTNGWALDPQPSHLHAAELVGCSTTTDTRSDDDDSYGFAVADATTTSSDFIHRKRPLSAHLDMFRLKEAKLEVNSDDSTPADDGAQQHASMKELLETVLHSVTTLASSLASSHSSGQPPPPPPSWNALRLKMEQQQQQEEEPAATQAILSDEEDGDEVEEVAEAERRPGSPVRPSWARRRGVEALLEEFLRRAEARDAQSAEQRDDVTLFLLSLAPAMRRLEPEKQSLLRTRMQQLLHEAEFGAASV
ncbi:uncharacterized protein LOC115401922 [Salarias fasciatus]|uniref:uncharacterized protein LOC115401922 n=1 Tax=Salarias fasciatus TaxID=181472 RepID=UPI00117688E7|nr:uncharacterized protein LOC115401922 [Salarias fasciatus]